MNFLRNEPMLTGAFLQALVLALSVFVFHWDETQVAAAQGLLLAFVALLVRASVSPVHKVAGQATQIATKTVEKLDGTVIGTTGAITGTAKGVIHDTVREVLGPFGGDHE